MTVLVTYKDLRDKSIEGGVKKNGKDTLCCHTETRGL